MALKTEIIHFRVGPELLGQLQQHAYDQEMRLGEFVRYALSQYLSDQEDSDESD